MTIPEPSRPGHDLACWCKVKPGDLVRWHDEWTRKYHRPPNRGTLAYFVPNHATSGQCWVVLSDGGEYFTVPSKDLVLFARDENYFGSRQCLEEIENFSRSPSLLDYAETSTLVDLATNMALLATMALEFRKQIMDEVKSRVPTEETVNV